MGWIHKLLKFYYILPWRLWSIAYRLVTCKHLDKYKFRKTQVGKASYIDPSVQIIGWKNVVVGHNTTLSEEVWLNVNHRDDESSRIIIGNNCHIGKRNFFSSGPSITLKDYCFTGIDCQFLGCGHKTDSPLIPYLKSGLTQGNIIDIGVNCWLTTAVTVMQGVQIGCGSIIGARSVVLENIPPFSVAVGNPCKVVKRFDFKNNIWVNTTVWNKELENLIPSEDEYLGILKKECKLIPASLLSSSRRFGWL